MTRPWTPSQRAEDIERDLDRIRAERLAVMRRVEMHLHDELHGLEVVYNARAAQTADRDELDVLEETLDLQLEALNDLIPKQQPPP